MSTAQHTAEKTGKAKTSRPGGRSATVVRAVRDAVEGLIAEHGIDGVTIPLVAERAGVNPSSVYRRWGDLPTMINDVATSRLNPDRPLPDTGDLQRNLTEWAREFIHHYSKPVNAALLRGGASAAGEVEVDCTRNRRVEATALIERALAAGLDTVGITADEVIDRVVAPIVYRIIFLPWTVDESMADRLVAGLFGGAPGA